MCLDKVYNPGEDPLRTTFKPITAYKRLDMVRGAPGMYMSPYYHNCVWVLGTLHTAELGITWSDHYLGLENRRSIKVNEGLHAFRSRVYARERAGILAIPGAILAEVEIPPYSCYITSGEEIVATQMRLVSIVKELPWRQSHAHC